MRLEIFEMVQIHVHRLLAVLYTFHLLPHVVSPWYSSFYKVNKPGLA